MWIGEIDSDWIEKELFVWEIVVDSWGVCEDVGGVTMGDEEECEVIESIFKYIQ